MTFFHVHAHSRYSVLDGMPEVAAMVDRVVKNHQPALALTDHGNMGGSIKLYKECKKAGILAFPGEEFYLVDRVQERDGRRFHVGMIALDYEGYKALVRLSSRSHQRDRFYRKPRIDLSDLEFMFHEGYSKHVALTSGCYFGAPIQALLEPQGEEDALEMLKLYRHWFPHSFVELQHHNSGDANKLNDDDIVEALSWMADELDMPTIITQDAHYCELDHQPIHDTMKMVGYYGGNADDQEKDWSFPGDGFHLARTSWVQAHHDDKVWKRAQYAYDALIDAHDLHMPILDNYRYHIPQVYKRPYLSLVYACRKAMVAKGLNKEREYEERLRAELKVIEDSGFADYFMIVYKLVQWCRKKNILVHARGSASGSLVCWLLGITQLDPIEWDLMFERFLSAERITPPDIDLDIDKFRRQEAFDWLRKNFDITPIGTYSTMGEDKKGAGSILVAWLQRERHRLDEATYKRKYGHVKGLNDLDAGVATKLRALARMEVWKGAGQHAAGIVITSGEHPLEAYIPTMLIASSGNVVTQTTMDDVELAGYVKMDLLGQRSLTCVAHCFALLGWPIGEGMYDNIPLDDSSVFRFMRNSVADSGIFTFEGYTQAIGCKEVKVASVEDLCLVNALYRPATREAGYDKAFLRNRADQRRVRYIHPVFEPALKKTYGVPIYQEQVMTILRDLGFATHELDKMLKAIKASNKQTAGAQQTFDEYEARYRQACREAGMRSQSKLDKAWDAIVTFSSYSFNRAHSMEYAHRGYYMAYLKIHHPLEFHAALLETISMANDDYKERVYAREARKRGVKLLEADVNVSGAYWTLDRQMQAVRRGLASIKGVGDTTAQAIQSGQPYSGMRDFIDRTDARAVSGGNKYLKERVWSGRLKDLYEAGALGTLLNVKPWER